VVCTSYEELGFRLVLLLNKEKDLLKPESNKNIKISENIESQIIIVEEMNRNQCLKETKDEIWTIYRSA